MNLFRRLFRALNKKGVFIIREIILGETEGLTKIYHEMWAEFMRANKEDDKKWLETHLKEDIPTTANAHLSLMKEAGFYDVACHWRYLNFAIFGGRKF